MRARTSSSRLERARTGRSGYAGLTRPTLLRAIRQAHDWKKDRQHRLRAAIPRTARDCFVADSILSLSKGSSQ